MFVEVFKKYLISFRSILSIVLAIIVIALVVLIIPNLSLIYRISVSDNVAFTEVVFLITQIIKSGIAQMTATSFVIVVTSGALFGINMTLGNALRLRSGLLSNQSKIHIRGLGALVLSIFGVGCASCGSILLISLFSFLGAGSLIAMLPLGGYEFGIVGIALLIWSTYSLAKSLARPLVC